MIKILGQEGEAAPLQVGIIGFDGVNCLDVTGPLEVLSAARPVSDGRAQPCYNPILIGVSGKTFVSQSRVTFQAEATLAKTPVLDTVIIPGGTGLSSSETRRRISEWLVANARRVRRVLAICNGIYPVAQSGLLDGRRVATHWRVAQDVSIRFPKLRVDATSSFLHDGTFYTCGGGTAAMEMTLSLVEEDYGSRVALAVARELVVRLRPTGENEQALDPSQFECMPSDRLAELPSWIATHLHEDLGVETLAARACLCPRHFSRLFKRYFKTTPASFVERIRLDEARRCLSTSRNSVAQVAAAVGFASADSFRRAFERRNGIGPAAYRRNVQFQGNVKAQGLVAA